jgi:hypothetical protein
LRIALAVENNEVVVTMKNVRPGREMYLPLGMVGVGRADAVHLDLILPGGGARQRLQYTGGNGVAPGRLLPFIVPMMPGSVYSVRTPLLYWRAGAQLRRIEADLARGAALQATVTADRAVEWRYVDCYGLQMFWSGHAVSPVFRP